jgi:hypothetical protein
MANVIVKYKGSTIAEMSSASTKTLKTSGKYCEDDITVSYDSTVAEVKCKVYDITLEKVGGWIKLVTLDTDVLEHINDTSFKVLLSINSAYEYVNYSGACFFAANQEFGKTANGYNAYGYSSRQNGETTCSISYIYYPANNTDTSTSLGGTGIFRVDGSNYYLKPSDGYIRPGNYRLVFTW